MRRRTRGSEVTALGGLAMAALLAIPGCAQPSASQPEFEVAAVKLVNPPRPPHVVGLMVEHGRARMVGATLRQIIVQAYLVQRVLVLGGPKWYDADQYDIEAETESPNATREEVRAMLQTLLADRFKL